MENPVTAEQDTSPRQVEEEPLGPEETRGNDDYEAVRSDTSRSPQPHNENRWAANEGRRKSFEDDYVRGGGASSRGEHGDVEADGPMSLIVRHLRFGTPASAVRKYFEQIGEVKDVYLPVDYERRSPRGFGFVEFVHASDAERALQELNETELDGSRVQISIAQHGRKSPSTMRQRSNAARRRYGGGGGGRRDGPYERSSDYERRRRDYSPRGYRSYERRPPRNEDRYGGGGDYADYDRGSSSYRDSGRHEYRDGGSSRHEYRDGRDRYSSGGSAGGRPPHRGGGAGDNEYY
eukprot:Protomagalhaensia_sp_Gyna_25__2771@NODE_259_length_4145_cov_52_341695_g200_i0_p2_GENE_NODE_259_length_4145_cov_52_341695_g200_i0NODE_259_length_4145_cov_52_341695_g200_i0_p2_ORF_typecomplete_len292_score41_94RRM_1/PF00076_22/8_1e18Nup35_RRM_2/PF14605_6/8_1e06RRM_2/PF04059_12/0_00042Limkainb1/PF11608_8/6_2e03Limkainb1/PF11608_8/0_0023RRM_5/PF13893_6/0_0015RRM_occluded/PF16842_5/0_0025RRM_3/PF08777_11/0_059RRM_3/PF08777_11/1_3e04_NODE_259_length_4145_cov_52_341695_g200_i029043779